MTRKVYLDAAMVFAVALTLLITAELLFAQTYPQRAIRIIVPTSAAGGSDIVTRIVAQGLTDALGQSVIVDNRPGAGGNIGVGIVSKSAPDGYTLLGCSGGHIAMNPSLMQVPFDPVGDFAPISMPASAPFILLVHPTVPVKSVKDLIHLGRSSKANLNYGTGGTGSGSHFVTELFMDMTKTKMVHIPFKGNGPATVGLLGGEIDVLFNSISPSLPHVRSGKLKAIAFTSLKRSTILPELPTVDESGVPGFNVTIWYAVLGRAGTSREIISRLSTEIAKLVHSPDARKRLLAEGTEPIGNTPEAVSAHLKRELARWTAVVKQAKMRPNS